MPWHMCVCICLHTRKQAHTVTCSLNYPLVLFHALSLAFLLTLSTCSLNRSLIQLISHSVDHSFTCTHLDTHHESHQPVTYHDSEGNGSRGMIVDSNEVDEESSATHKGWQHECRHHHLSNPNFPC